MGAELENIGQRHELEKEKDWFELCGFIKDDVHIFEEYSTELHEVMEKLLVTKTSLNQSFLKRVFKILFAIMLGHPIVVTIVVSILGMFFKVKGTKVTNLIVMWVIQQSDKIVIDDSDKMLLYLVSGLLCILFIPIAYIIATWVVAIPFEFIISSAIVYIDVKNEKKKAKELNDKMDELENRLATYKEKLSGPLQFIPPSYRNAASISYFYDCYINGRSNTIKEAIHDCDEYLYRMNLNTKFEELINISRYNSAVLQTIEENTNKPTAIIYNKEYYYY